MKLVCLNVGLFEKNNAKLSKFLNDQQADVLALQEVVRTEDGAVDCEYVSKPVIDAASSLPHGFFGPVWSFKHFEKENFHGERNFKRDFGGQLEFGNYLKTRFEMQQAESVFVEGNYSYVTNWNNFLERSSWAMVLADLQIGDKSLRVINYHGIWSRDKTGSERTKNACREILNLAREAHGACIVCGDFNLFPNTASMEVLNEELTNLVDLFSIQSTRPESNELSGTSRNVVDYVLVNDRVKVKTFQVLDSNVSDHLPLVLEFEV